MALRYEMRSFTDLITAVMETLKIQSTDTVELNRIKRNINTIYIEEVLPFRQWIWLRDSANITVPTYYSTGTVSVTANSVAITLSAVAALPYSEYNFSVDGSDTIYHIYSHTAGTAAMVLEAPYDGATDTAATYKIWNHSIPLPSECKEILDIGHSKQSSPLENMSLKDHRRLMAMEPKREGPPDAFTTSEFRDASEYASITSLPSRTYRSSAGLKKSIVFASTLGLTTAALLIKQGDQLRITGSGNYTYNTKLIVSSISTTTATNDTINFNGTIPLTESSTADSSTAVTRLTPTSSGRYRELIIHPSINTDRVTLHADYIKHAVALEGDNDEPLMPIEDRIILYYGALWLSWTRQRNPEEAGISKQLFDSKLMRMAGKQETGVEKPTLIVSNRYLSAKRNRAGSNRNWKAD